MRLGRLRRRTVGAGLVEALDGDVCLHGVNLLEEDGTLWHEDDMDETMEITISSD